MICLLPFFSQQDKTDGHFLLQSCCTTQIARFLALALTRFSCYTVRAVVPDPKQISGLSPIWPCQTYPVTIPRNNHDQRSNFPAEKIYPLLQDSTILISQHELLSTKIRYRFPALKIIQLNYMHPLGDWTWMTDLQVQSWRASDYIAFISSLHREHALSLAPDIADRALVWPLTYDVTYFPDKIPVVNRDIDILFGQRCSQSNYTHHREFLQAIRLLQNSNWHGKVAFTDTTRWLEKFEPELLDGLDVTFLHATDRLSYAKILARTKCAIAMMEQDLHGGIAIREAIISGAIPLLLDTPAYRELLGPAAANWPGFVTTDPKNIAEKIRLLVGSKLNKSAIYVADYKSIRQRVQRESYQSVFLNHVHPLIRELYK